MLKYGLLSVAPSCFQVISTCKVDTATLQSLLKAKVSAFGFTAGQQINLVINQVNRLWSQLTAFKNQRPALKLIRLLIEL